MNIIFQGGSHQIFYGNSIIILTNQAYEAAGLLEFNKLEREIAERLGNFAVTPCVGVWIEIPLYVFSILYKMSLPVWECGLK